MQVSNDRDIDVAFESVAQRKIAALQVAADPFFDTRRVKIVALAAQYKLPTIYQFREYVIGGGLMSYGIDLADLYSPSRRVHWTDTQGREGRRSAGRRANKIPIPDQPEDGQITGSHGAIWRTERCR